MSGSTIQLNVFLPPSTPSIEMLNSSDSILLTPEQQKIVLTVIDTIEEAAQKNFSKTVLLTMKRWKVSLQEQPYSISTTKILVLVLYLLLAGPLFLVAYSSLSLLVNIKNLLDIVSTSSGSGSGMSVLSALFSAAFGNVFTNEGALLCGFTDVPGILYLTSGALVRDAYVETKHQLLAESYRSVSAKVEDLTPAMCEELYLGYISMLQTHGITKFYRDPPDLLSKKEVTDAGLYRDPDLLSEKEATHARLADRLKLIDQEIDKGLKFPDLWGNCIKDFKQGTSVMKIAKCAVVPPLLLLQALAVFLTVQNMVLIFKTPVGDLFSNDPAKQINEAFYVTQIGSLFPAVITLIMVNLVFESLFWQATYKKMRKEKVLSSFEGQFDGLLIDSAEHAELLRIRAIKYTNA